MKSKTLGLSLLGVLLFAMLTWAGAQYRVPLKIAPVTLQTVAVLASGLWGGRWVGLWSQLIYLLAGCFFPVFAGETYGWEVFSGKTSGYLIGFPIAAFLLGVYRERASTFFDLMWWCSLSYVLILLLGMLGLVLWGGLSLNQAFNGGFIALMPMAFTKCVLVAAAYYLYRKRFT